MFGIARAFVAHTDSRFDPDLLCQFMRAYQTVQPLTIGELWAVAITLRIVLIENLRRLADQITEGRTARLDADAMADRLLGAGGHALENMVALATHYERSPLFDTFSVQLLQRLHDEDPQTTPAVRWLHEHLAAQHTTAERIVATVHQQQGDASVTVRNVITSMRLISEVNWTELFERISPVDDVLRAHSGFSEMDFATRNLYRGAIEALARGSPASETYVAQRAVSAAQKAQAASTGKARTALALDAGEDDLLSGPLEGAAARRNASPAITCSRTVVANWSGRSAIATPSGSGCHASRGGPGWPATFAGSCSLLP